MRNFSEIMEKKTLAKGQVTTMSYDIETTDDSNINQEIRESLINNGWQFVIPEVRVIHYNIGKKIEKNVDTPRTTAWKENVTPKQACNEFLQVLEAYNVNHVNDTPKRFARGKAFAVNGNEYDSVMKN